MILNFQLISAQVDRPEVRPEPCFTQCTQLTLTLTTDTTHTHTVQDVKITRYEIPRVGNLVCAVKKRNELLFIIDLKAFVCVGLRVYIIIITCSDTVGILTL